MKKRTNTLQPNALWTLPSAGMLLCLTIAPLVLLLIFSFMNRNLFAGQPWPGWTIGNITRIFQNAAFWKLLWKSLGIAAIVTVICIVAAYPAAWAIAKVVKPKYITCNPLCIRTRRPS